MTTYTVHLPRDAARGSSDGLDRAVLVKDGFHWPALVLPVLWLLFNRAWRVLLVYVLALAVVAIAGRFAGMSEPAIVVLEVLLTLFVALHAGEIQSAALTRRGYPAADVVVADKPDEAERRFFSRWLDGSAVPPAGGRAGIPGGQSFALPPAVIGLFPQGGTGR